MQSFQNLLLVFMLLLSVKVQGQFAYVPDSNFRKFIKQNIDSNAIVGTDLDTSNIYVTAKKNIFISNLSIKDLEGIQYFDSLLDFRFYGTQDSLSISILPSSLKSLFIGSVKANIASQSSSNLESFECRYCGLSDIPVLPNSLRTLNISFNNIHSLSFLPDSITSLILHYNPIDTFPALNLNLQTLGCRNTVTCLPKLPDSLRFISYDHCIPNKPLNLQSDLIVCDPPMHYHFVSDSVQGQCNDSLSLIGFYSDILWGNGDTNQTLYNLCEGTYQVTAITEEGCYYSKSFNTGYSFIDFDYSVSTTCGVSDATIMLDIDYGCPPYTISILNLGSIILTNPLTVSCQYGFEETIVVTDAAGNNNSVYINIPKLGSNGTLIFQDDKLCPGFNNGYYISHGQQNGDPYCDFSETGLDSGMYVEICEYMPGCIDTMEITIGMKCTSCDSLFARNFSAPDCGKCNGYIYSNNITDGLTINNIYDTQNWVANSFQDSVFCGNTLYYITGDYHDVYGFVSFYDLGQYIYISYPEGCTSIYPGDANNDGVTNNIDLLSIGLAYGDTGSTRVDTTITWDAKYAQDWTTFFADSVNHKHADCNGNGLVNDDDTTAILLNYGLMHQRIYNNPYIAGAPSLQIDLPDTLAFNTTYQLPVLLGDSINAATTIYGVAFTIGYDQTVVIPNTVQFIIDSSWLGSNNTDLIYLQHSDSSGGNLDIAITRKDRASRNGYGAIGILQFKTKSLFNDQIVYFNSSNITAISHDEIYQPVNSSTDSALFQSLVCEINTTTSVFNACNNWCDAAIQLNVTDVTGSLHYAWSILQMDTTHCMPSLADTASLAGLPTGIYNCIITDSVGCSDTISTSVIAEISTLDVSALAYNEGCDSCDGSISLTVMGGYAPYSFHWDTLSGNIGNNSYSGKDLSSICLNAAAFQCVVTDSLGCETWYDELFSDNRCFPTSWSDNIVPECIGSSLGYLAFSPIGFNACSSYAGFVTSSPTGTTVDYSYYPTIIVHDAQAGIYEYTLITGNGCDTSLLSFEVPTIDLQIITANPICGQCNGKAIALVNGDTLFSPPGVFEWHHDTSISSASIDSFICQNQQVGYSISVDGCLIDDSFTLDTCIVVQVVDDLNSPGSTLFRIIPNPNHGNFVLELAQRAIANASIEIINTLGEIIYSGELQKDEDKKDITLTQLSAGIYCCRIINNYNVLQQLFVVR